MNNTSFAALYAWELRRALRSPLFWLLLAFILVAFVWGSQSTARMHRAQNTALEQIVVRELETTALWKEQAARNAVAAAQPLAYWQDVTHVAGFSQYFLIRHSFKPHLPASVLATGVSDLLPAWQQVKLTTPFAREGSYEFHSPRALALGQFDLAFAVAYLLPIVIILGFVLPVTLERDHGVLRLVAAQSVTPRQWLHARMLALLTLKLTGICAALFAALALAGVSLCAAGPELATAMGIVVAYVLFWVAVVYAVLTRWPHAWSAVGTLVGLWAMLAIALPMLANQFVTTTASAAAQEVDVRRRLDEQIEAQAEEIVRAAFEASPVLAAHIDKAGSIDYATRLSFLTPQVERSLEAQWQSTQQERERVARSGRWWSLLVPSLGVQTSLARLAGTDLDRHRAFEVQTRDFQLELRTMFYTRMHEQIAAPTPPPLENSYGRFSFTDYAAIPTFRVAVEDVSARVRGALPQVLATLVLAALIAVLAAAGLRRWPENL